MNKVAHAPGDAFESGETGVGQKSINIDAGQAQPARSVWASQQATQGDAMRGMRQVGPVVARGEESEVGKCAEGRGERDKLVIVETQLSQGSRCADRQRKSLQSSARVCSKN